MCNYCIKTRIFLQSYCLKALYNMVFNIDFFKKKGAGKWENWQFRCLKLGKIPIRESKKVGEFTEN
jgi:hypothetical protein